MSADAFTIKVNNRYTYMAAGDIYLMYSLNYMDGWRACTGAIKKYRHKSLALTNAGHLISLITYTYM